jgi:membrane protease YdiL (CAAX protease family)
MKKSVNSNTAGKALVAALFIAAAYLFMFCKFIPFPYNIPFICSVIIAGYLFFKRPLKLLGIQRITNPFLFVLAAAATALAAELLMDWLVQPLVNKLCNTVPDYSYFSILENKTALYTKYIFYTWLSAAAGEELLFRGFIFDQLNRVIPPGKFQTAAIMTIGAVLFAFAHGYEGLAGIVLTFFWALLFGVIYKRSGNIWFTILVHGIVDTIFLSLAYTGRLSYYELPNQVVWGY